MADTLKYVVVQNVVNALEYDEIVLFKLGYFNDYASAEIKCNELMAYYDEDEIDDFANEYGVEQYGVIPVGLNTQTLEGMKENV